MMTRRFFLTSSGLGVLTFGAVPGLLLRAAEVSSPAGRRKVLVVVFQRGACDGLNVVVPYGESEYYQLRPTIAVPRPGTRGESCLDLDGTFGLHPALESLLPIWKEGSLAAVHAVSSPDPTRSHFDAQDFMESGTPGVKSTEDGWMNRALQADTGAGKAALQAVSMTPTLPRSLQGRASAVAMSSIRDFGIKRGPGGAEVAGGFEGMYAGAVQDVLHGTSAEAFEAMSVLEKTDPGSYRPAAGAHYPRGRFADSLRQVAQLIKAEVGLEMAFAEMGGWDHHAAEGSIQGQLANRLREFGATLAAFHQDLGDRMSDVVVVTLTEFGRTVRENGNRGTDHGHGGLSLVIGGGVRGAAVRGRWPGLKSADLHEGRDVPLTTDFRDLLAEVLSAHLGARDLSKVFPGHRVGAGPGVMRG